MISFFLQTVYILSIYANHGSDLSINILSWYNHYNAQAIALRKSLEEIGSVQDMIGGADFLILQSMGENTGSTRSISDLKKQVSFTDDGKIDSDPEKKKYWNYAFIDGMPKGKRFNYEEFHFRKDQNPYQASFWKDGEHEVMWFTL